MSKPPNRSRFDPAFVREISVEVYKGRLEQTCKGNVERMLTDDNDGGKKLSERAGAYDPLTRLYIKALEQ